MKKLNVIDLMVFKEQKQMRKEDQCYGRYLRSLKDEQLPTEMRHLQDLSSNTEFINKGMMLSREFAMRATGDTKHRIETMNSETLKLL